MNICTPKLPIGELITIHLSALKPDVDFPVDTQYLSSIHGVALAVKGEVRLRAANVDDRIVVSEFTSPSDDDGEEVSLEDFLDMVTTSRSTSPTKTERRLLKEAADDFAEKRTALSDSWMNPRKLYGNEAKRLRLFLGLALHNIHFKDKAPPLRVQSEYLIYSIMANAFSNLPLFNRYWVRRNIYDIEDGWALLRACGNALTQHYVLGEDDVNHGVVRDVLIDLDNTVLDFSGAKAAQHHPESNPFPQSKKGFYRDLKALKNAVMAIHAIENTPGYRVKFCTAPSMDIRNAFCLTEKAESVIATFGEKFYHRMIFTFDKGSVKGDFLIDDLEQGRGQENFGGELIVFGSKEHPDWLSILDHLKVDEKYRVPLINTEMDVMPISVL